jgi:ElaA protein
MNWLCKKFNELNAQELYAILQLRNEVFVVEQNCVFQDADNKDQYCYHLAAWQDDKLLAYARIVPPEISYSESSIGRIVTSRWARGTGAGRELVMQSINELHRLFGNVDIRIGAQLYLKRFYESFGFTQSGDIYIEDNIPHIEMILSAS